MKKIDQASLAKMLKVSRTTITRSLNNHPSISAEMRSKVQGLAERLGYRPSPGTLARRAKLARSLTVGAVIGLQSANDALDTYPFILKGIRERAGVDRIKVDVSYLHPLELEESGRAESFFREIRANDWRGVILIYPFPNKAVRLIAENIPVISVLETYFQPSIDIIDTDDAIAIFDLVSRLQELGHRRIGFVSWNYSVPAHWVARRFGSYVEALFVHGLEFNPDWIFNVHKGRPMLTTDEINVMAAKMVREEGVTAWVCAADHQAYSLVSGLSSRGIKIPQECSITGFDGLTPPPGQRRVTSMRVPHEHIGASAVMRLCNRIFHPTSPRRRNLIEPEFIKGETLSTCSPRKR